MDDLTGWTIEIDREVCMGSGVCTIYAASTFSLDATAHAVAAVPAGDPFDSIVTAIQACPTGAIRLVAVPAPGAGGPSTQ